MLSEGKLDVEQRRNASASRPVKDFAGNPRTFAKFGPMLFREEHGQIQLAFVRNYAGRQMIVTDCLFTSGSPCRGGRTRS